VGSLVASFCKSDFCCFSLMARYAPKDQCNAELSMYVLYDRFYCGTMWP
jgi:hypothetical protein